MALRSKEELTKANNIIMKIFDICEIDGSEVEEAAIHYLADILANQVERVVSLASDPKEAVQTAEEMYPEGCICKVKNKEFINIRHLPKKEYEEFLEDMRKLQAFYIAVLDR